jgi:UDP-GlcNAc:undecaprenyl-phosphate GlcNAc-1-phosphate transferase
MEFVAGFLAAMIITVALIPALEHLAPRFGLVDAPGGRKQHVRAMPRIGGIAMAIGFFISAIAVLPLSQATASLLLALLVLLAFGICDDRIDLNYRFKFMGQMLAAVIVVFGGGVSLQQIPVFESPGIWTLIGQLLSVIFLVGTTNAINLSDGLDGLAGGLCLLMLGAIAGLGLTSLSLAGGDIAPPLLALAAIGSLLGFLRFNSHPARIFMGDAGSQFLGFTASVLALYVTQSEQLAVSGVLPLLLLGLPIYDTLSVMARRIAMGRSPFAADRTHVHYRLTALGLPHTGAVLAVYVIQATLIVAAYMARFASDGAIVGFYVLFCLGLEIGLTGLERGGRQPLSIASWRSYSTKPKRFSRTAMFSALNRSAALLVGAFVLAGAVACGSSGADIAVCAALAAFGLAIAGIVKNRFETVGIWLDRIFLYIAVTIAVYAIALFAPDGGATFDMLFWLLALLVPIVLLGFVLSEPGRLRLSPLDFLVLFSVLALPHLPGLPKISGAQTWSVMTLLCCYYATELVLAERSWQSGFARASMIGGLSVIVAKTVLS